jgi:hypothetical protein
LWLCLCVFVDGVSLLEFNNTLFHRRHRAAVLALCGVLCGLLQLSHKQVFVDSGVPLRNAKHMSVYKFYMVYKIIPSSNP